MASEPQAKKKRVSAALGARDGGASGDTGGDDPMPGQPEPGPEEGACPHCFLKPCIVEQCADAPWLGTGNQPSPNNSGIRKDLYRRFWHTIANCGGWSTPQYEARKKAEAGLDRAVTHRREVMPECVLTKCRTLYPNPKGQPYMGHKWE